jgi:hypothetical protein
MDLQVQNMLNPEIPKKAKRNPQVSSNYLTRSRLFQVYPDKNECNFPAYTDAIVKFHYCSGPATTHPCAERGTVTIDLNRSFLIVQLRSTEIHSTVASCSRYCGKIL